MRPTGSSQVAVLIGSLRSDGYSARLARALAKLAQPGLRLEELGIRDLQLYQPELEISPPPAYCAFREALDRADAVLFVTPEYNRSIPGALKNAIDIGSRPYGEGALLGKPAAIISQSPGAGGGMAASHAIRQSLLCLDMPILPHPEAYIGGSASLLGMRGEISDEGTRCLLQAFISAFAAWIRQNRSSR